MFAPRHSCVWKQGNLFVKDGDIRFDTFDYCYTKPMGASGGNAQREGFLHGGVVDKRISSLVGDTCTLSDRVFLVSHKKDMTIC